ncbi:alpha/beta hydrolase family protein [Paucibacter soli]|uniref:alpha/beta hydrolase family protein n=1 Tax=Paucibacter soli TaxID=3133433 RepID=UPI0030A10565
MWRRSVGRLVAALSFCLGAAAIAAPPLEDFFRKPQIAAPKLSPNGQHLAVQVAGSDGVVRLAVIDLLTLDPPKVVAGFSDADVQRHEWVNDQRLVFNVSVAQNGTSPQLDPGLWAVNRDGGEFRPLIKPVSHFIQAASNLADRRLDRNWALHSVADDGSDDVFVLRYPWSSEPDSVGVGLARLNTRTGKLTSLAGGAPSHVTSWVLDSDGKPAALTAMQNGRYLSYLRDAAGHWQRWQEGEAYQQSFDHPVWFGPEGQALVQTSRSGFQALYRLDRKTLQREAEPLISLQGYDFNGSLVYDKQAGKLLGLHYETDASGSVWLHPQMKAAQASIDARLTGTVNHIHCNRCLTSPRWVVSASSDRQPTSYYLYTPEQERLEPLSASRPWIKPAEMGLRDMHRIKARDGLELPVLVTQPAGKAQGARPAVLLVHGGPYLRGTHWTWEPMAQFLASRGYVVIEPEFRGSTGFGSAHFRAGWKQWGLAMQDDLADALQWSVQQGLVDPKRVCIAGASYGGYATLMGLIKQPELYRCGVNWVGVTDIELLYSIHWSDLGDEWKGYGMPVLVGDRDKDAAQLRATSPLQRAAELKRPLLMAYGAEDRRVPVEHGRKFKNALHQGQELEWVVYDDEGHGWRQLKTQQDFWGRVERFLARHLGAAP